MAYDFGLPEKLCWISLCDPTFHIEIYGVVGVDYNMLHKYTNSFDLLAADCCHLPELVVSLIF